jgi:hypothetical protein
MGGRLRLKWRSGYGGVPMKRLAWLVALVASLVGTSACYRTRFLLSRGASQGTPNIEWDQKWYHDAIYGLAEISGPVHLDRVCPGGVSEVYQETSFVAGFVQGITGNLYSPQVVTVYCVSGAAARVVLNDRGDAIAYLDEQGQPTSQPVLRSRR